MCSRPWPARFAWILVLGSALGPGCAEEESPPLPRLNPAEGRARATADLELAFTEKLFSAPTFPSCEFNSPERAREILGPYHFEITYFDRALRQVETPETPGPYAAIVQVIPENGAVRRRFKTLYRVPAPIDPKWRPDPAKPDELAERFGLDPSVVASQLHLLTGVIAGRHYAALSRDSNVSRILAGLSLTSPETKPIRVDNDATAQWRQWWVDLTRKVDGIDPRWSSPFVAPRRIAGPPAPILRDGTPFEAGVRPDAAERIDAVLRAWAADSDQAFAVCIARHGVIVLHRAYGLRDGKPMTVHTKSWMASVTKPMSASLMMMLVDQGLVRLEDSVDRYLPPLRGIPVETPLTIRHLYTHTNGLAGFPKWSDDLPDLADRVAIYYPYLPVGRNWQYNGTGYMLGGKIIENVSGEAIPAFYRRHLLDPLGMNETDVTGTQADARSVPLDIARFGQMLLNRGAYGPWRFFREATFESMLPRPLTDLLGPDTDRVHGIGLIDIEGRIGHGAASMATFQIDLKNDLVVVMTRNSMGRNFEPHNIAFWNAISESLLPSP